MKPKLVPFILLFAVLANLTSLYGQELDLKINKKLKERSISYIERFDKISEPRKSKLKEIGDFIVSNRSENEKFNVLFVCTHNSRRSHIADTWFKFGMLYNGLTAFESYTGGIEASAFNENAIDALKRVGFTVKYSKKVENPVISITPGVYPIWQMQSKKYNHSINPKSNFVAVMVCSEADASCPIVPGANGRFSLPYDDPRYSDGTPSENQKYDEIVELIGIEMLFLTDYIKDQIVYGIERNN